MRLKLLPILLILTFGAISIFGFLGPSLIGHGAQHDCLIPLVSGGACPTDGNSWALISHHISGFSQFTQSTVTPAINFLIILIVLASVLFFATSRLILGDVFGTATYHRYRIAQSKLIIPTRDVLRWFILHNKLQPNSFT